MFSDTYRAGLILIFSSFALAGCGGGSSLAQPALLFSTTLTPTLAPTPTPKPLSVIPPCPLPASRPTNPYCPTVAPPGSGGAGASAYAADVNAAIDRVIAVRPDLFDLNDVLGGQPRVKDFDGYMVAVVAALGEMGLCGNIEAEGELGVKRSNDWGENWSIWYSLGYTRRKFLYGCSPPLF